MEHAADHPDAGTPAAMTPADHALDAIWYGWGDAYDIGHDEARGYWARRRDGKGSDFTAADPDQLRAAIQVGYSAAPVSDDFSALVTNY